MSKTNLIILVFGLVACISMSLMMQHIVKVSPKMGEHPVATEVNEIFAGRLQRVPKFELQERHGQSVGVLTIHPKVPQTSRRLARVIGLYVWGMQVRQEFDLLEIVSSLGEGQPEQITPISCPQSRRLPRRVRKSQASKKKPPAKSAPAKSPPKAAPAKSPAAKAAPAKKPPAKSPQPAKPR